MISERLANAEGKGATKGRRTSERSPTSRMFSGWTRKVVEQCLKSATYRDSLSRRQHTIGDGDFFSNMRVA